MSLPGGNLPNAVDGVDDCAVCGEMIHHTNNDPDWRHVTPPLAPHDVEPSGGVMSGPTALARWAEATGAFCARCGGPHREGIGHVDTRGIYAPTQNRLRSALSSPETGADRSAGTSTPPVDTTPVSDDLGA